jgi:hypothetical protein
MSLRAVTLVVARVASMVLLLHGCSGSGPPTYVWLDVDAKPAVRGVTKLEITVSQGGERLSRTFGDGLAPLALPTDLTITPNSHVGTLTVEGVALGTSDVRVASGTVSASITVGGESHATLMLLPLDFQVNTTIASAQIITDEGGRSGRQTSASDDGSLVVVYEDISTLGRYDGLGRLFDGDAAPRQNAISQTKDDFVLNQLGTESVWYISVTAAPAGGFLTAWAEYSTDATFFNARAFDSIGTPLPEVTLSATGALDVGGGHVAAFRDGSYVAVWSQSRSATDGTHEIRARLLDATGQPRRNSITGNSLDYSVGTVTTHNMELPAAAVGPDQSFVVAWLDLDPSGGGAVHCQRLSHDGLAQGAEVVVATTRLDPPEAPNLAAVADGYLVVYTDGATSPADTDVMVRYLNQEGLPTQPAYRVNTSTDGVQSEPAIAVAGDGRTLIVWTDSQSRPEDTDWGSIRGRALQPFGLPIGTDFAINTSTSRGQYFPSVAAAAHGAFLVTWQDESTVGPDVDETGIRGRMIYPDYAPTDGGLGATCGASTPCAADLRCVARGTGSFCHLACSDASVGQPCAAYGGVCIAAATEGTSGAACLFR